MKSELLRVTAIAHRHKISRYGFHGISHHSTTLRYAEIVRREPAESNLVTLCLEGGSSAAAVNNLLNEKCGLLAVSGSTRLATAQQSIAKASSLERIPPSRSGSLPPRNAS
jgi:acetate kinase